MFFIPGGANHLVEKELKRPLQYLICFFHALEKVLSRYFKWLDGKPVSPNYDGPIGKKLVKGVTLKPIVNFEPIPTSAPELPPDLVASLNTDMRLLYELCHGISNGPDALPDSLAKKQPGKCHQVSDTFPLCNLCPTFDPP